MKHPLLVAIFIPLVAGCETPATSPAPELHFRQKKDRLVFQQLDYGQPACRGSALSAFYDNSNVVMIELWVGTSQRSIFRDFYFDHDQLQLVTQRTWWLLDDQAYELKTPKRESETHFYFAGRKLQQIEGNVSPIACRPEALVEDASRFLKIAKRKNRALPSSVPSTPVRTGGATGRN